MFELHDNNMPLEKKLNALMSVAPTLPDIIAVLDLANAQIIYTNESSLLSGGGDNTLLRQMNAASFSQAFIHPDDLPGYHDYFNALLALKQGETASFEYRVKSEKGEWQWCLSRSKIFHTDAGGKPTHCISTFQNINAGKITEQTLGEKNQELLDKNDELAAFAFMASHDLKEPLRKIMTFSSWLVDKEGGNLSEQGKIYLQRMQNAVSRMDLLITDILTLLRLQDKQQDIELVNLDLVFRRVLEELDIQIRETGAIITAENLPEVKGYSSSFYYLFINIIGNAIKFRKKDTAPEITITYRLVSARETGFAAADNPGKYLELAFKDNGIGFEQQYSKIIFQMFQRLHGKSEYPGTGIGLAICKKIMDNSEGFIRAESNPGEGACFYCYFPII